MGKIDIYTQIDTWNYIFFVSPILKMSFFTRILGGYFKDPEVKPAEPVEKKEDTDIQKKI